MSASPRRKRKPQSGTDEPQDPLGAKRTKTVKSTHGAQPAAARATSPAKGAHSVVQHNPEFLTAALRLPLKYRQLESMFNTLDTVCSLFHSRKQILTFQRLLSPMEIDGHKFTLSHLAQIITICDSIRKNAFTLERRIITDRSSVQTDELVITRDPTWEAEPVTRRRNDFHNRLLMLTAAQHAKFLRENGKQVPLKVEVWDADWSVDDVEDVAEAELPATAMNLSTASGSQSTTIAQIRTSMQEVEVDLEDLSRPVPEQLQGISAELIEKVRLRQQQIRADEAARPAAQRHRRALLSTLPSLADTLRAVFVFEKGSIALDTLLPRLVSSLTNTLSRDDVHEQLREISKVCPEWCQLITSPNNQKVTLVKLNRKLLYADVRRAIEAKLTEEGITLIPK